MAEEKPLLQQWQEYREQLQRQMDQAKERLVQIGMDEVAGNPINPEEKKQLTDYLKEANEQMVNAEATIQQLENQERAQQEAENDDNPTHDDDTPEHDDEEHEESEEERDGDDEPDGRDRMRNNPENTPEDEHLPDDDEDREQGDDERQFNHENEQNHSPLHDRMEDARTRAAMANEAGLEAHAKQENTVTSKEYKAFMKQCRKMNNEINKKTEESTVDVNGKQVKVGERGEDLLKAMEKEAKESGRATCSFTIGAGDERREITFDLTKDANGKSVYSITDPLAHDGATQIINKKDGDSHTPQQLFTAQLYSSAKQAQLERDGNNIYMDLALSKDMSLRVCPADLDTDAHNRQPDGEKDFNFYLVKYELNENGDNTGKEQSFCQITDKNGKSAQKRVSELFDKYGLTQDDMKDLRKQKLDREAERKEARKEHRREKWEKRAERAAHAVAIDAPKATAKFAKNKIEKAINDGADLGGMR